MVYIELFLIDNTVINFYILYLSGRVLKIKIHKFWGLFCAILGAVFGLFQLMGVYIFNIFLFKIILSFFMVFLSYFKYRKKYFSILLIFYIISFAFGGMIFALHYLTQNGGILNGIFVAPIPFRFMFLIILTGHLASKYLLSIIKFIKHNLFGISLMLTYDDMSKTLCCYSDTGNNCTYFNKPVIFVNSKAIKDFKSIYKAYKSNIIDDCLNINIVYIPYTTAGGKEQTVFGFRRENTQVFVNDVKKTIDCYFAVVDHDFSGCDCLINPQIIE